MRNTYAGICYRCGEIVDPGDGHFERKHSGVNKWRVQHADCAIAYRGTNVTKENGGTRPSNKKKGIA